MSDSETLQLDRYAVGEEPRLAVAVVAAVAVVSAAVLIAVALADVGVDGRVGALTFAVVFGALPAVAGVGCGWRRLGFLAAAASGLAPGVAFSVVVAVGATLGVGSFGGGDSPLAAFALLLSTVGFVWATGGFVAGTLVAVLRARRD